MTTIQEQSPKSEKKSKTPKKQIDPNINLLKSNLPKNSNEILKISKVHDNSYRVNWLMPDTRKGDLVIMTTYLISNSRYLTIKKDEDSYIIKDETLKIIPLEDIVIPIEKEVVEEEKLAPVSI